MEVGRAGIDARVEQGDRHAAARRCRRGGRRGAARAPQPVEARSARRWRGKRPGPDRRPSPPAYARRGAIARGSRIAENPFSVLVNRNSGLTGNAFQREVRDELLLRRGRRRRPAALVGLGREPARSLDAVGEREGAQHHEHALVRPDARRAGRRRDRSTRRRLRASTEPDDGAPPPPAGTTTIAAAITPASAAMPMPLRHRIGVEAEGIGRRLDEPRGGRDHRRVVRAELERRGDGTGQRRPELGVGRDAADDRDPLGAEPFGRLQRPADERAHDRALVRRRQVGAPLLDPGRRRDRGRCRGARS